MKVGYVSNNLTRVPECELFMLPGLTCEVPAFRIAGLTVSRLELPDLYLLETSQFMDDLEGTFLYGRDPFFCVFTSFDPRDDAHRHADRELAVLRLARALWLLKEGDLYNPAHYINYRRKGGVNTRDPRLFGRAAYELDGYTLGKSELLGAEGIYEALTCFDHSRSCPAIELADALFCATHNPAFIEPTDGFFLLLGCVEALVGGGLASLSDAPWLGDSERDLLRRWREVRNPVAHGRRDGDPLDVATLRSVVRCLLRESIIWSLEDPGANPVGEKLIERARQHDSSDSSRLASVHVDLPRWEAE